MATSDWLSIDEITRLWSEETGQDPAAFKQDLEAWFAHFVKQPSTAHSETLISGGPADNTNRLMGMLGARYLERSTFATYCRERGYEPPRFWFAGRAVATGGGRSRTAGPESPPPDPTWAGPKRAPADDEDEDVSELAAFQSQIATMRDQIQPSNIDLPSFSRAASGDSSEQDGEAEESRSEAEDRHRELTERALAASAEAEAAKARLAAAEQRITELTAAAAAWPARTAAGSPGASGSPAPGFTGYRDPSASRQLLRSSSSRGKRRLRFALSAVLLVGFVALSIWGVETAIQLADYQRAPIPSETTGPTAGDRSTAAAEPGEAAETSAAAPTSRTTGTAEPLAAASDLAAAKQQIVELTRAAEASDKLVARLQDELAIARQAVDLARQSPPGEASGWTRDEHLAFQALSAEVAMARREVEQTRQKVTAMEATDGRDPAPSAAATAAASDALKQSLEINRQKVNELTAALERAKDKEARQQATLEQAEAEAAQARASSADAKAEIDSLGKKLDAAFASVAEANKNAADARSATINLQTENTRLTKELAAANAEGSELQAALERAEAQAKARQQEPNLAAGAAAAHAAKLQRELEAARRQIDQLSRMAKSAQGADAGPVAAVEPGADRQPAAAPVDAASPAASAEAEPDRISLGDGTSSENAQPATNDLAGAEIEEQLTAADVAGPAVAANGETTSGDTAGATAPTDVAGPAVAANGETTSGDTAVATAPTDVPAPPPAGDAAKDPERVAALEPTPPEAQDDGLVDGIALDELLVNPAKHVDREVVVTGPVVWLLWQYRLQSDDATDSLVIDVEGLPPEQRERLTQALDGAGFLGEVHARIRGRIDRQGPSNYRLTASELVVID